MKKAGSAVRRAAGSLSSAKGGRGSPKHVSMKTIRAGGTLRTGHPGTIPVRKIHKGGGVPRGMTDQDTAIARGIISKVARMKKKKKSDDMKDGW